MLGKIANNDPTQFKLGDKVFHYADPDHTGVIIGIDTNLIESGYSSTTCEVLWDGDTIVDIQWTNKLVKVLED